MGHSFRVASALFVTLAPIFLLKMPYLKVSHSGTMEHHGGDEVGNGERSIVKCRN